jgi:poly(3-hydroxyalkanoate) synthetase
MAVAGGRDHQAPPESARLTLEKFTGAKERKYELLPDYGHFDLLIGKTAAQDVFAKVEEWLARQG